MQQDPIPHEMPLSSFILNFLETSVSWVEILEVLNKNVLCPFTKLWIRDRY